MGPSGADTLLSTGGANTLVGIGGDDLFYVNSIGDP
jgi:Ca2+-binding RTX toxin-like protein